MPFDPALPFEEVEDEFETLSIEPKIKPSVSGFDPTQPFEEVESPEEQGIIRQVADIPLGIARGGVTGIKMMTDILGADNAVSKSLAGVEGYMADLMSAQAKEDQQEISRIMKDAEDKGFGEQVKAGIKAFSIAPVDIMSQALGTMAPVIATGLVGSAAKLGTLGVRGLQLGIGAGMGAGETKGEIYNEVKNELVNSGVAEDVAEKSAVEAQSYGGKNLDLILLNAGLGAASTLGAEGIITRILTKQGTAPAAGIVSRVLKGGLSEAGPEAGQEAGIQLSKNVALQREGFDVDPSRGVVASATMGAIAGAPLGGIAGAVERPAPIKTLAEENLEQTNEIARKVAENGAPLTASAIQDQAATNLRQDELAKQLEAQLEEELVAVKKPTTAAQKPMSKDEFKAIYSQVAPEELDAAEAGFTEQAVTDATEEGRISAQNALEAIKEVKATVTPPAPPVAPTITPAVTPAVPTAQLPTPDAAQEIIQPEGVRQEPQDGTQVQPTEETGVGGGVFDTARGQEEGQVAPTPEPIISEIPATSELVGAEPTQPTIREVPEISPIVGEEPAAIVEQEPVAPAEPAPAETAKLPIEEPPVKISRGENFSMYGEYNVSIGDKKHRIYRDPERGYWYDADVQEEAVRSGSPEQGSPSLGLLSTETRKDAIAELVNKYKEEQQAAIPLEAPTPVTTPPVTEAVTPAEAPAITPAPVAETPAVTPAAEPKKARFDSEYVKSVRPIVSAMLDQTNSSEIITKAAGRKLSKEQEIDVVVEWARRLQEQGELALPSDFNMLEMDQAYMVEPALSNLGLLEKPATPTSAASAAEPAGISVGNRIKLGKSPQTYTIEEVIPQSATERELGEQYYSVKNERTGETQVVEARDLKQVKGKGARKIAATATDKTELWATPPQEISSAATSINQRLMPSTFKRVEWQSGTRNADIGGGRFDNATEFLSKSGVENVIYDPYNRTQESNKAAVSRISGGQSDTATINNVLNVIAEPESRELVIRQAADAIKEDGKAYFLIYEGNAKGVGSQTKAGWQENRKSETYVDEISKHFGSVTRKGNLIIAEKPSKPLVVRRQAIDTTPEGILITPPDQQYTFNEVFDVAYDMFGGEIPEGFTIVNDSKDKDFEFKAAYIPESGEIIVNLAYLNKSDDIRDTITHELGHYIFGDPEFRAAFDQFIASLSPEARAELDAYVETAYNKETGEIRLEEKMVRAFVDQFINEEQAPAWRSMLDAIKRFLNKLGFKFNISDRDAISVFTAALDRYKAGEAISREGGARKIIDDLTAMDAEYLAAVERGDMETAQRMVDEAAKKAGYKFGPVYHGTKEEFTEFKPTRYEDGLSFFSLNEDFSRRWAKNRAPSASVEAKIKQVEDESRAFINKLFDQNPQAADSTDEGLNAAQKLFDQQKEFERGRLDGLTAIEARREVGARVIKAYLRTNEVFNPKNWREFAPQILNQLNINSESEINPQVLKAIEDGNYIIWENKQLVDAVLSKYGAMLIQENQGQQADTIAIRDAERVKSADPVTYDDAGNVIPLSQRFRPTSPDIRRMAAEPRREQVAGMKIGRIITTPPGITQKTTDIIRSKFFDSTKVSPENTSQAWAYISQFMDKTDNNNNKFAGYVNQVTEEELAPEFRKGVEESMGASLFSVELANYAGRLAVQGDTKMLAYMIRNGNKMPTGEFASGVSQSGRVLNAFKKRLSSDISGVAAYETELESNVERLAAVLFGTNTPSKEQIKIAQDALTQSESAELDLATEVADDIKRIESRTNKGILQKIDDFISGYDNPKKDQLLLIFANLIRTRDVDGITISYKPAKVSISDRIANLLVKNLANYRDTLIDKAASGLESTFWRTMSSQENKPGLLGELDQAQNNELAKIVKATLIKMKLAGEPKNTKMTDIEKVASILNESKLSEEKRIEADKRIVAEIDRRRQEELSTTENPDAVNAKYDSILKAWNDSMSRQLNMPVSDSMLQRLVSSEMKEQDIKIRDLVDEADGKVVAEKKQNIINSIIRKIYGVSKESETGIEMDESYDGLKSYLEQTLDNMYALSVEEKNAAYAKRQAQISLRNTAESQAQSIINRLADQLSDTPAFPEKQENEVKAIVQQDLKQIPDMNRKQPWTSQLTAKLMRAGVSETQAQIISDLVWRQHEIKAMDRESKELQTAAEKGSLAVIIDRIKNTPLEKQQSPEWKQEVIKEYLRDAGLSSKAAETAAKLYDSVISERLAAAKQKAFEDTLAKAAPWNNYASRNGKLAKDALKKIRDAIRTGVLDPEKNAESIIAAQSGWTGFTKEQYQRIVELDTILNDPNQDDITKREAMFELNKIITKAKMPVRFKDALGAYYIGNALMGIPTALVNIVSPISFSIRNLMVDIAKYTKDNPAKIPVAFETFLDSMRSWYNQTSYAFKNQIYLNDVVEYLNGQNVLRETFDKGKKQWAEGKYAEGFANMAVGMTQITGRVLSALDQGAISMLENQNITRYAMAALENAKKKVPKNKIVEFANMTLDLKRRVIIENIAAGMDADRAGVLADLAVKSELRAALSEYEADTQSVLDSAINDALQSVGRNKVITIEGIERQQKDVSDSGILSYWPIKMLETVSRGAGNEGSGMQIFSKMVYGFALVPARTFHTAAWFSPYGFLRLAIDKYKTNKGQESPYAMSLQTEAQYRQRLTESIAGSIAMLGLFALRSGSSDEDEDKKFKIVITGNGPNAVTDKQYYDSWIKKYKPYSINIVLGDTVIPINIGRGGEALFFPIMLAGALDDYEIKSKQNLTKKEPDDLNAATEMLGSAFFALAQRGPYAAFTEPLFDASKQGRVTENLVSQLGYFGKTFVPVLGASITRNISDIINDPVDRSSIEGAIYANTPIVGPWVGTKALNALGQPIRADDWGDKLYKLGVPVVFSFPKNTPENELNELILKQGGGPTLPTRANAQKRFGDVLTSKEFESYVREYGRVMSDKMFKNRTRLANMKSADYDDELEKYARGYSIDGIKIKGASDSAVLAVKRMRQ